MEKYHKNMDINNLCRTCLSTESDMKSVFETNISNMISMCAFIQVTSLLILNEIVLD